MFLPSSNENKDYIQYRPGVLGNLWSPGGDGDWKSQPGGSLGQDQLCEAIPIFLSDKAFDRRFCAHKNTQHILYVSEQCTVSQARS